MIKKITTIGEIIPVKYCGVNSLNVSKIVAIHIEDNNNFLMLILELDIINENVSWEQNSKILRIKSNGVKM